MAEQELWIKSAFGLAASLVCLGCGRAAVNAADGLEGAPRDTVMRHEDCPADKREARREDLNSDGRSDLSLVPLPGGEQCRVLDFNFDGRPDAWVYFDRQGRVRRKEADFDRDGKLDEIVVFAEGAPELSERATTLSGRLDTWQHWQGGRLVAAERDSDGNAIVDQWWEYPDGRTEECPLVHSDVNGDGRPDPGATVDLCEGGSKGESAAAPSPAAAGGDQGLPVEVPQETQAPGGSAAPESQGGQP